MRATTRIGYCARRWHITCPSWTLVILSTTTAASPDTDATPSAFAARVVREATRRGVDRAARRVVLGDGALWIWHLADEHVPDAVQIVDRFHAKQHLSDVATSTYGAGSDLGAQWARPPRRSGRRGDRRRPPHSPRARAARRRGAQVRELCRPQPRPHWTTRRFGRRGCAPRRGSSRPAARWPSARGACAPECIGPSPARIDVWPDASARR